MISIVLQEITANPVFLGLVFILFVLSIKKLKKIVFNALWISLAAVLFPIAMNRMFGLAVAVDAGSIIFYLTIGLGAYFVYLLARSVYTVLGIAEKAASPLAKRLQSNATREREKKVDKLVRERERERKDEEKLRKIMKKSRRKPEDEYLVLKDKEEEETENRNIIRKFREAQD